MPVEISGISAVMRGGSGAYFNTRQRGKWQVLPCLAFRLRRARYGEAGIRHFVFGIRHLAKEAVS